MSKTYGLIDKIKFNILFKADFWFGSAQKLPFEAMGGMFDTDNGRDFLSDTWSHCDLECFLSRCLVQ